MLRSTVLALAGMAFVAGLVLCWMRVAVPGIQMVGLGGVTLLALCFERWRYRNEAGAPAEGWETTGERFEDPESHQIMEVEFHPATGARRYVSSDGSVRLASSASSR